jgi:hypothetical protein
MSAGVSERGRNCPATGPGYLNQVVKRGYLSRLTTKLTRRYGAQWNKDRGQRVVGHNFIHLR